MVPTGDTGVWWCPWMVGNKTFKAAIFVTGLVIKTQNDVCIPTSEFRKGVHTSVNVTSISPRH